MNFENIGSSASSKSQNTTSYVSIYMKYSEQANIERQKIYEWLSGARVSGAEYA